ncbi:TrkA family potassium uptake protein [Alicyclobacillus sp. SO9]|uniref:potassium channel family protein n=1 Tax=Alicyclobacillus sp. SO9 TaxID=2665646 RepID=UPI0018E7871A|nr:TrkA family potassium uptake protein [Alicyclobacillus sp. SO9]QQE77095.1 TrkA family potassium uptake protein [Alicyclobacillus sp. SO9]
MGNGLRKRRDNHDDYIIIAGCSRAGAKIASTLSSRGKDVVIIDKNNLGFRKLSRDYAGFTIEADATDVDVLKGANIGRADVVFAATENDNVNIMISQIASQLFGVPKVITRLFNNDKEVLYRDYTIQTIHPTNLTLLRFESLLSQDVLEVTGK